MTNIHFKNISLINETFVTAHDRVSHYVAFKALHLSTNDQLGSQVSWCTSMPFADSEHLENSIKFMLHDRETEGIRFLL